MVENSKDNTTWFEYYEQFAYFSEQVVRDGCQPRKMVHGQEAEKAIVLVHGLSDSPHYLLAIGEFFHFQLGYDVYLPLLQGHGLKNPEDRSAVLLAEWKENVNFAIRTAAAGGRSLSIGGLSTGGALSFYAGCTVPAVTGDLYLFSAALGLKEGWLGIAGSVKEFLLQSPLTMIGDSTTPLVGTNPYRYDDVCLNGARELARLIGELGEMVRVFEPGNYFTKRIFSVSTEYDDVISLKAINRLGNIVKEENFVQYVISKNLKVEHASVVLKDPIYAIGATPGDPPLEHANPVFQEMMEEIREFQQE